VLDDQFTSFLTFISGFGSGIYVGIASGTAEPFIIPLMTILIGSSIYEAIGTTLFIDCIIGLIAGIIFLLKGHANLKPVLILAITGVIFAFIGSFFSTGTKESDLKLLIAIVLILFGLMLIRGGIKRNVALIEKNINLSILRNHKIISFILFGSIIGFLSGYVGMGSSGSMTILLIFIMGYDLHTSIGTSLLMMSFIAFSGSVAHGFILGDIILQSAMIAGAGAMIGACLGSLYANRINEELLGRVIGVIITVLGCIVLFELIISNQF
jgi:uncharacterized membrane protein YfcA